MSVGRKIRSPVGSILGNFSWAHPADKSAQDASRIPRFVLPDRLFIFAYLSTDCNVLSNHRKRSMRLGNTLHSGIMRR